MITPVRLELIHVLVRAAVEDDLPNFEIKNRINHFTRDSRNGGKRSST